MEEVEMVEVNPVDLEYAKLTNRILKFILEEREKDSSIPIVDLVMSFCFKNDVDPVEAGDAISQDYYLKQLIENNMKSKDLSETDWWFFKSLTYIIFFTPHINNLKKVDLLQIF